jgi:hypothetical protein
MKPSLTASNPPIEPPLDPTFVALMIACETTLIHAVFPLNIPPTEEEMKKSLPASEIISRLIQDPNDTNRDAYFAQLFLEKNITHDTQETIINSIKAAKKITLIS